MAWSFFAGTGCSFVAETEGTTPAAEEVLVEGLTCGEAFLDGVAGVTVGVPGTSDGKGLSFLVAVALVVLASSAEDEDEEREEVYERHYERVSFLSQL